MRKPGRSGILKSVILSSVLGGILHQEIIAANTKTTSESIEKPGSKNMGGGAKIKLDTVLIDTLFGVKIFFRIGKRSVVNEFAKTTDVSLEGVTDSDSTIFLYSSPVDIQEFTLHRIIGNPEKAYLLQIQTIPASPPSGNGFLVIAPVRRELKVLFPGRLHFSGHFQKSTQGKSSDPEGVVSLDVWNGNFGIPFPLSVHSTEDSTYWNLGFIKPDTVLNAIVYKFPVAGLPEKNAFRKNENVTLYLDMSRKKKLKCEIQKEATLDSGYSQFLRGQAECSASGKNERQRRIHFLRRFFKNRLSGSRINKACIDEKKPDRASASAPILKRAYKDSFCCQKGHKQ
jgi:hypothetical protein